MIKDIVVHENKSSLISRLVYNEEEKEITIFFRKYYIEQETYVNFCYMDWLSFGLHQSLGKFYLNNIKNKFLTKQKQNQMADRIFKIKIDTKKINKDWLFVGEKGVYLNFTFLQNDKEDDYGNCGMVVQDVPTEIYKKDKTVKGVILGNGKQFSKQGVDNESKPGTESGTLGVKDDVADDLPF